MDYYNATTSGASTFAVEVVAPAKVTALLGSEDDGAGRRSRGQRTGAGAGALAHFDPVASF